MELDVENVLLYVDDAVRYDALTDALSALGPTFRTIAASTHTPTSFGSLLTGLLPPHNDILSFKHTVPPNVRSVFDIETHRTSLAAKGGMNESIAEMFRHPPRATVEELDPPFFHVVRRPGGHAPYDGFEWDEYEYRDETAIEYLWRVADDPEQARRDYAAGVRTSFAEFERVLDVLDRRGLTEETLVVYTSDHGESLGEYGFFGHTHLATEEVVYVPTTFIHPELDPGTVDRLFHHVDLLPTVAASMKSAVDIGRTDGVVGGDGRTSGYNHLNHTRYKSLPGVVETIARRLGVFERTMRSLWDADGGHVFVEGSTLGTSLMYLLLLTRFPFGRQVRHDGHLWDTYRRFVPGEWTYGNPGFDRETARSMIDDLGGGTGSADVRQLEDETADRLRDMGYL